MASRSPKSPASPVIETAEPADDGGSRTLRRGLQLLDAVLQSGREGLRVVDLCRTAGLEAGYVAPLGRFRYVAGPRLAQLQAPPPSPSDFAARLQPVLARVSQACGDAAFAIVREGAASHCIARQVGTHPVQMLVIQVGTRQPLGVGAAGLALLAALPEEDAAGVIAANAPVLGRYGGMTPERMGILVRATRERGWAVIGNHATEGVLAVGMAVPGRDGSPAAAISVASTMERMPRARQQLIVRAMREGLGVLLPEGL
jgi:DNA-binding IclR family transcriptional regulator